jgi:ABC-type glycerol-3-phosphate transport system substrate-binding protein
VDWGTAEQRWNLAMSTGDLPDVGDMFYLPQRIVQGHGEWGPLDLTSYIDAGQFGDWERIVQSSRDESTFDGKVYGIPWRIDIRGWNARSDLWPTVPETLEDMEAQGLEILTKPGVQGAGAWFLSGTDNVNMAGLAFDTTILTPDYTASNLLDPKWIDAATWMRDMARKRVLLTESQIDPSFNSTDAFFSGVVAAQWGGVTILEGQQAQAPDVAPFIYSGLMPAGPVGESRSHGSCAQWSVFENSQAIDEAVAFVAWLSTDPQRSFQVNEATSTLSADTDVQALQSTPYLAAFFEQAETMSLSDMPIPAWGEMRVAPDGPLETLGKRIIGSDDDLATIFAEADQQIKDIFAKYA